MARSQITRRSFPGLIALVLIALVLALPGPMASARVRYQPPVIAPIADGWRPPAHRYGPGNRGVEYRLDGPTEIVAAAAGTAPLLVRWAAGSTS
jgi:hypothetical protein